MKRQSQKLQEAIDLQVEAYLDKAYIEECIEECSGNDFDSVYHHDLSEQLESVQEETAIALEKIS